MDEEKLKVWMRKINTCKIQKPAEAAKLKLLSEEVKKVAADADTALRSLQQRLQQKESQSTKKIDQILSIELNYRKSLLEAQKKIKQQKQKRLKESKGKKISLQQYESSFQNKIRLLKNELNHKNKIYLDQMGHQLVLLKELNERIDRINSDWRKQNDLWLRESIRQADRILQYQGKDLEMIDLYQKQLINRCERIEKQYEKCLQNESMESQQKFKLLFRKLESMIADIQIN